MCRPSRVTSSTWRKPSGTAASGLRSDSRRYATLRRAPMSLKSGPSAPPRPSTVWQREQAAFAGIELPRRAPDRLRFSGKRRVPEFSQMPPTARFRGPCTSGPAFRCRGCRSAITPNIARSLGACSKRGRARIAPRPPSPCGRDRRRTAFDRCAHRPPGPRGVMGCCGAGSCAQARQQTNDRTAMRVIGLIERKGSISSRPPASHLVCCQSGAPTGEDRMRGRNALKCGDALPAVLSCCSRRSCSTPGRAGLDGAALDQSTVHGGPHASGASSPGSTRLRTTSATRSFRSAAFHSISSTPSSPPKTAVFISTTGSIGNRCALPSKKNRRMDACAALPPSHSNW